MKKRIIAFITVLALCFSVLCIPASAASARVTKTINGVEVTIDCYLYRTSSNATASMSNVKNAGNLRMSLDGTCEQTPNQGNTYYYLPITGSGTGSCSGTAGLMSPSAVITKASVTYYTGAANSTLTYLSA